MGLPCAAFAERAACGSVSELTDVELLAAALQGKAGAFCPGSGLGGVGGGVENIYLIRASQTHPGQHCTLCTIKATCRVSTSSRLPWPAAQTVQPIFSGSDPSDDGRMRVCCIMIIIMIIIITMIMKITQMKILLIIIITIMMIMIMIIMITIMLIIVMIIIMIPKLVTISGYAT